MFFNEGSIDISGLVSGIDVEAENNLFHFNDYITSGNPTDLKHVTNSIILGKGLAEKLLVAIGDVVQVTTSKGDRFSLKNCGHFSIRHTGN